MKCTALALLLLASAGLADTGSKIEAYLAKGEKALEATRDVKGTKLLRALEAAKPHFKRARALAARGMEEASASAKATADKPADKPAGGPGDEALARAHADATKRLVAILNAETVIYMDRGALQLATKRNAEALALLPDDVRAKMLEEEVKDAEPDEIDAALVDNILRSDDAFARVGSLGVALRDRRGAENRYLERRAVPVR